MTAHPIQGVIFDLDGTLLDSMPVWASLWRRWMERRGFPPNEALYRRLSSLSFTQSARLFAEHFKLGSTPAEVLAEWRDIVLTEQRGRIRLKPGAAAFLELLDAAGVPYGVLSACLPEVGRAILAEEGVAARCRFVLFTDELGLSKAAPEPFLLSARALETAPAACAVAEDTLSALAGARAAGMYLIALRDEAQRDWGQLQAYADLAVEDFYELKARWPHITGRFDQKGERVL